CAQPPSTPRKPVSGVRWPITTLLACARTIAGIPRASVPATAAPPLSTLRRLLLVMDCVLPRPLLRHLSLVLSGTSGGRGHGRFSQYCTSTHIVIYGAGDRARRCDAANEGRRAHRRVSDRQPHPLRVRHLRPRQCRHARSALRGARPDHV